MLKIIPFFFIVIMVISCNKKSTNSSQVSETYELSYSPEDLFEYNTPIGWFINSEHGTSAELVLIDSVNKASINLQISDPILTEFNIDTTLSELRIGYPDIEIFEHREFKVDNQFAYQINFAIGRNKEISFSTVGIRSDEFLAIFTLTCLNGSYQYGLNSLSNLLNSIQLK